VGLIDDLGSGPVALDTPPFIYFIEEHPRYLPIVQPVFAAMTAGTLAGVTSGLTLLETLREVVASASTRSPAPSSEPPPSCVPHTTSKPRMLSSLLRR